MVGELANQMVFLSGATVVRRDARIEFWFTNLGLYDGIELYEKSGSDIDILQYWD